MSGDVQPRKRKDKKKQKEDDGYSPLNEDVNIHVHKEGGTGGNICAKIVFFFLFSALIVLIGLIIKENQGLSELEEFDSESRYSQIFEGWVDKSIDEHEDINSPELSHEHDDHDLDEEDDHYESEENIIEETEEEQSDESNTVEDDEQDEDEDSRTKSEEETNEASEEDDEVPASEEDNTVEEDTEEEYQQSESQEKDKDETEEDDVSEAGKYDDIDDEDTKEESTKKRSVEDDIKDSKEDEVADKSEEDLKRTVSKKDVSRETLENIKQASKEVEGQEQILKESPIMEEPKEEIKSEPAPPSSGLATKIGVGVALLVVAYNVFFRKRTPEKPLIRTISEKEPTPDLSRRNTLVPPLSFQEVEPDLPEIEREEEEYSEEDYSDEDSRSEHRSAREEYQQLSSNYKRSLNNEDNPDANKNLEDDILEPDDDINEEELEEEEELEGEELEDEEIEDDFDKYDEDEDEELLKRLEAKYGKLGRDVNVGEEAESDSDKEDYEHSNITNKDDFKIKADIDMAQKHLDKNAAYANKLFEALLVKHPFSPRILYGKATTLDILAEEKQSNELLQEALDYYMKALNVPDVPDQLFVLVAERYIDRARFIGQYKKAISAHWQLIERFPDNSTYLNNLAVTYLTINLIEEARSVLKRVLSRWPNDGFALVHYGFILKTTDNNLEESIVYMKKGLQTKDPGVIDGRFYFHLGDALTRLNKNEQAMKLYEEGVQEKVFMSKYQRSLYNVPRLAAKPWWEPSDIPAYQKLFLALKDNWHNIRNEGLSALNDQGYFRDEAENLKDTGTWKQLELFARGQKFSKNCAKSPVTCSVIQSFSDAKNCRRGQSKFSVMHPGTHVWPHCGPTNCRLRIHLGLKVPPKTFIRVAEETRSWEEGEILIFDDSFEHEVWHNGSNLRLVLIVDVWHPELTSVEKKSLSSI